LDIEKRNNVILIGMPGAGKSTIGVILAKRIGFQFIDTDLIIQTQERCQLQQIIDTRGLETFRRIEEQVLLDLNTQYSVIATGGSVIYSEKGMAKMGEIGSRFYLQVSLESLQKRIADMGQRGLVMERGQTFAQLYRERTFRYRKFADVTISCQKMSAEKIAEKIELEVKRNEVALPF